VEVLALIAHRRYIDIMPRGLRLKKMMVMSQNVLLVLDFVL
jgi:hypothetical protein